MIFFFNRIGAFEASLNSHANFNSELNFNLLKRKKQKKEQKKRKLGVGADVLNIFVVSTKRCCEYCYAIVYCGEQVLSFINILSDLKHTPTCTIGCLIALLQSSHPIEWVPQKGIATVSRRVGWKHIKIIKWFHSNMIYELTLFSRGFISLAAAMRRSMAYNLL